MMSIKQDDLIQSVADALQYISYYHPVDYIKALAAAYERQDNPLRALILADPAGRRTNTKDNTPAVINVSIAPGSTLDVIAAAKDGDSEAESKFAMLNPSDSIVDWVLNTVPTMGAGWCPPGMLGIGIGGTTEKAMLIAKESLMDPINIQELIARGTRARERGLLLFAPVKTSLSPTLSPIKSDRGEGSGCSIDPAFFRLEG